MKRYVKYPSVISFDPKFYREISAYLHSRSISQNHILIPVRAVPSQDKIIVKYYIWCQLETDADGSRLIWKMHLSPLEALAVSGLLLMYVAAWCFAFVKYKQIHSGQILFLLLFSVFVFSVVANYLVQYKICKTQFIKAIRQMTPCGPGDG